MSNVLIGIIGVILFIGLALAGALFLGPRFQESTNNSRASAAVQAVSQVASAANMYRVQEGRSTNAAGEALTPTDLEGAQYLKSVPSNPTSGGGAPVIEAGATAGSQVASMTLGGNGKAVCEAINKQSGAPATLTTFTGTQGCAKTNGAWGTDAAGDVYKVFASI